MTNNNIFRALSSPTRIRILQELASQEMHLSGLAREIGISVPVISKHIKILEDVGLVHKRVFGNVHLLSTKITNLESLMEPFVDEQKIEIEKENSIFDALSQVPGIKVETDGKNQFITSIDGEEGYFIYEVDGKLPKKSIDEYKIKKNLTLDFKKIVSVKKKKITVNLKPNRK